MINTLGLPTIFFTHSAADTQWDDLYRLMINEDKDIPRSKSACLIDNPAIASYFFHVKINKYIKTYYQNLLGATDYWFRYEWQHRGSVHVHGLAWVKNSPRAEKLKDPDPNVRAATIAEVEKYADELISTMNPAYSTDGTEIIQPPSGKSAPHPCAQNYSSVTDQKQDLIDLISTCQRHTKCSESYCLTTKKGRKECRYGFPKPLQEKTTIIYKENEPELVTRRNDPRVNSHNQLQLSSWRANCDMQLITSKEKVTRYAAKYATKSEPRSKPLVDLIEKRSDNDALKTVQRIMIGSVAQRDYSAQETCHLLLQQPLYSASRPFVCLPLDGSRELAAELKSNESTTVKNFVDKYKKRPDIYENCSLIEFTQKYNFGKNDNVYTRQNEAIVTTIPYVSSDPKSPTYDDYIAASS